MFCILEADMGEKTRRGRKWQFTDRGDYGCSKF